MSYPIGAPLHTGQTFIVFTLTNDMRAWRPAEIGFCRYCSERKQWEVILNNQPPLVLRRGMTAEQITPVSYTHLDVYKRQVGRDGQFTEDLENVGKSHFRIIPAEV